LQTASRTDGFKLPFQPTAAQSITTSSSINTQMNARTWKISCILALLLLIVVTCRYADKIGAMSPNPTSQQGHFSTLTDSIFIPFIYEFSIQHEPQVMCTIQGVKIEMPVDTGSTGLLIGSPILPNISSSIGRPAHHFFTSSKILYVGRLVELPVSFQGEAGSHATATVPVLIVDKSWRCPAYDPEKDQFECPPGPNGEAPVERDTSYITYMGVGFGRNQPRDGMSFGMPRLNPFLNIHTLDGSSVSMRTGYIVSKAGVQLGLTTENTRNFEFMDLEPGVAHDQDPRDWTMASMCFTANGGGQSCGSALVDTGISQMYLRPNQGVAIPTVQVRNPNKNGNAQWVKRVTPGTDVVIGFPSLDKPVVLQSLVVGEGPSTSPSAVIPLNQTAPPYINTGRSFLFDYSIAFDAVGGRLGFRAERRLSGSNKSPDSSVW